MTPRTTVEVLVNENDRWGRPTGQRRLVKARLVKRNARTVWVVLPDGRVVQRDIRRDVPELRDEWWDGEVEP